MLICRWPHMPTRLHTLILATLIRHPRGCHPHSLPHQPHPRQRHQHQRYNHLCCVNSTLLPPPSLPRMHLLPPQSSLPPSDTTLTAHTLPAAPPQSLQPSQQQSLQVLLPSLPPSECPHTNRHLNNPCRSLQRHHPSPCGSLSLQSTRVWKYVD